MFGLHLDDFLKIVEVLLKVVGVIGALVVFIIGLIRYQKDQKWKRAELAAKEYKEFKSDTMVRNTLRMIDLINFNIEREIELFPDHPDYDKKFRLVDWEIVKSALRTDELENNDKEKVTKEEIAIRDNVSHFLSYFERFEQFLNAKLFTAEELEPYIKPWISKLENESVNNYIKKNSFKGTQDLIERFKNKKCKILSC
jgi:hypothetical protein